MAVSCAPWDRSGVEDLKRFTDTKKWDDPWFWELSTTAKLLWFYLLDHCDNAGAVEFNAKIASFKIGCPIEPQHLAELGGRLKTLKSGKLWITKFIRFQFGSLEPTNNPHRSILKLLSFHGLRYPEDVEISSSTAGVAKELPSPSTSAGAAEGLPSPPRQGKDRTGSRQGKDQEGVQGEGPEWKTAKSWWEDWRKSGSDYTEFEARGAFLALQANGWMWGRNKVADPRAALERQIQTDRDRKAPKPNNSQPAPPLEIGSHGYQKPHFQ